MTYGAGSGLTIKSDEAMDVIVPLSAIGFDGVITGRYGPSKPLVSGLDIPTGAESLPIRIETANVTSGDVAGGRRMIRIDLRKSSGGPFAVSDLPHVKLGDQTTLARISHKGLGKSRFLCHKHL